MDSTSDATGTFSIIHLMLLLFYVAFVVAYFVSLVKILHRTGYSGWWSLLSLVPVVNIVALWMFSRADWPIMRSRADRVF